MLAALSPKRRCLQEENEIKATLHIIKFTCTQHLRCAGHCAMRFRCTISFKKQLAQGHTNEVKSAGQFTDIQVSARAGEADRLNLTWTTRAPVLEPPCYYWRHDPPAQASQNIQNLLPNYPNPHGSLLKSHSPKADQPTITCALLLRSGQGTEGTVS